VPAVCGPGTLVAFLGLALTAPSLGYHMQEDDRPKKKVKASSKGMSLAQMLPPPKNDPSAGMDAVFASVCVEHASCNMHLPRLR
jgi:hypothetical protein